jgi:chemotaxis protein MotB
VSDDEALKSDDNGGGGGWIMTFADLMSLLMCFFVLLLSFAQVDAVRFKKMAESMKDAFGVQREIPATEIVKGVSVIKQEWSPSVAEQAVINEIRQETSDVEHEHLKVQENEGQGAGKSQEELQKAEAIAMAKAKVERELNEQFEDLQDALEKEIGQGQISVEREKGKIIIRIQEKGSFASGSAQLDPGFNQVMDRISQVLATKPGRILVAGHTDNIPIHTGRFRSNWELSAARAVTVLHSLLRNPAVKDDRVTVQGFAETRPLEPNNTPEGRAKNRRVELVILRGKDSDSGEVITVPAK